LGKTGRKRTLSAKIIALPAKGLPSGGVQGGRTNVASAESESPERATNGGEKKRARFLKAASDVLELARREHTSWENYDFIRALIKRKKLISLKNAS